MFNFQTYIESVNDTFNELLVGYLSFINVGTVILSTIPTITKLYSKNYLQCTAMKKRKFKKKTCYPFLIFLFNKKSKSKIISMQRQS